MGRAQGTVADLFLEGNIFEYNIGKVPLEDDENDEVCSPEFHDVVVADASALIKTALFIPKGAMEFLLPIGCLHL